MTGDVAGMEGTGAVDGDAPAPGVMLRDHVDGSPPGASHLPQRRRGVMAEDGAVPAREHRRHLAPARSDGPVAHGVHPAVKGVEPAGAQPRFDRARRDARGEQLRSAHDAMLLPGDPGDQVVYERGVLDSPRI